MAHTYVVSSASYIPDSNPNADPTVTIVVTVDGTPVTVQIWLSAIQQAQSAGGMTAVKNLVAPVMLDAATRIQNQSSPTAPTQLPTGTFSQ